jgi:hypothetical protein
LDLELRLFLARRDHLPWLDMVLHFRLHSYPPQRNRA